MNGSEHGLMVESVHALPRRVHLRAPVLRSQRAACRRIADRLAAEYDRVSIRPVTGSIVLESQSAALDAQKAAQRVEALLAEETRDDGRPLSAGEERVGATRLAEAVVRCTRGINDEVRAALGGEADLGTLAPIGLVAAAAAQIVAGEASPPPWSNLMWYALRSFISFNPSAMRPQPR